METRTNRPSLEELGPQFSIIDSVLVDVLAKRGNVSLQVGEFKLIGKYVDEERRKTIRRDIERARLEAVAAYARRSGVDSDFARAILLLTIAESCKLQIEQAESKEVQKAAEWLDGGYAEWFWHLRQGLYELTQKVAPVYEEAYYGQQAPTAIKMYLDFEWNLIHHEIENLRPHGLEVALDLGCATGNLTRRLAKTFKRVIAYDISPDMIQVAQSRENHQDSGTIEYQRFDIEKGLDSIGSNSVDLVVMSLGTGSDISDLKRLLIAIKRVLSSHGRFVLTFYNQQALVYQGLLPWSLSLKSRVNMDKKYLEVVIEGKTYPVFAHFYTTSRVLQLLDTEGLHASNEHVLTYPTVGSILPNAVLGQHLDKDSKRSEFLESIKTIDKKLVDCGMGAYILVSGSKSPA